MNRDVLRQWVTLLTIVILIVMNILSNALPFNDMNTGEISDMFEVYFVPAGYVFSIWGLIYLGLVAYGVYQLLPAQRDNPRLRSIFWPFVISSLTNVSWLFAWHYNYFFWTVVLMLVLLATLLIIYVRLGVNRQNVSTGEKWMVHIPFSIYLGWISVASIANISDYLWYIGWNGFGISDPIWAVIMLGVAVILGFMMAFLRRDAAYVLVLAWAFAGIGVRQAGTELVAYAAWGAAVLALIAAVLALLIKPRQQLAY
ncbi:MAG: tryptophan-rich sensory protein [Chloroflexi bacterium]|nr:MAG: tryptophan-rich sensory protein [Chloroflexota bacterium]